MTFRIVVNDDGVFSSYKDLGLVSEVFSKDTLSHLPEGTMAVGHVRYGTTGGTTRNNCQPIEINHQKGKIPQCSFLDSTPFWLNTRISPGSKSLVNSAPTADNAQTFGSSQDKTLSCKKCNRWKTGCSH